MPTHQDARQSTHEPLGASRDQRELLLEVTGNRLADWCHISHDPVLVLNSQRTIILWNRAAERLYGWAPSEALGQRPEILLKTKFPKPLSEIQLELETKTCWEGELVHTTRAGRAVVVASRWSLQSDQQGHMLGVFQLERDISEQQNLVEELRQVREELKLVTQQRLAELETANEALVESQARFQQVAEAIQDVFWLTNPWRTTILYVNPAYERIWGRTCESLYADPRSWLEAIHPEDRPRVRRCFSEPMPAQGYEHSYRVVHADCSVRWVLDRSFPVQDHAGGSGRVVGIIRDVTERKELEKTILAISEREQHRIGQDLHDDLCQQLAAIEFLSKALQQQLKVPPQAAKAAEIAKLIRSAIAYTRQLARGLAPLSLEAEGLMRGLQDLAARTMALFKVDCAFECSAHVLIQDPASSTHLFRIAQEALANSIKHGQATRIKITLTGTAEGAQLVIQDNGKGIAPESEISSGSGLRIMRYRADMIGGNLAIQSKHPTGTTVTCTFPLTAW